MRWPMSDPASVQATVPTDALEAFRDIRDGMEIKLTDWLKKQKGA